MFGSYPPRLDEWWLLLATLFQLAKSPLTLHQHTPDFLPHILRFVLPRVTLCVEYPIRGPVPPYRAVSPRWLPWATDREYSPRSNWEDNILLRLNHLLRIAQATP